MKFTDIDWKPRRGFIPFATRGKYYAYLPKSCTVEFNSGNREFSDVRLTVGSPWYSFGMGARVQIEAVDATGNQFDPSRMCLGPDPTKPSSGTGLWSRGATIKSKSELVADTDYSIKFSSTATVKLNYFSAGF